jgi:hypothetical protein
MTDKEVFTSMLDKAGVVWSKGNNQNEGEDDVVIETQTSPQNDGYNGFVAIFTFGENEQLLSTGVWE